MTCSGQGLVYQALCELTFKEPGVQTSVELRIGNKM
jgi:hypothetical protein